MSPEPSPETGGTVKPGDPRNAMWGKPTGLSPEYPNARPK
jgi:hypothetical protein